MPSFANDLPAKGHNHRTNWLRKDKHLATNERKYLSWNNLYSIFEYFIANKFITSLFEEMSNSYHRSSTTHKKPSFLKTMHDGFNYFH